MGSPTIFRAAQKAPELSQLVPHGWTMKSFFIEAESTKQLLPKIQEVTWIFVETSRRHGFDVSFAAGKTKALIRWAAKESVKRRRDMTNDDGSCTIPVFGDQTLLTSIVGLHNTPAGFLGEGRKL